MSPRTEEYINNEDFNHIPNGELPVGWNIHIMQGSRTAMVPMTSDAMVEGYGFVCQGYGFGYTITMVSLFWESAVFIMGEMEVHLFSEDGPSMNIEIVVDDKCAKTANRQQISRQKQQEYLLCIER